MVGTGQPCSLVGMESYTRMITSLFGIHDVRVSLLASGTVVLAIGPLDIYLSSEEEVALITSALISATLRLREAAAGV